MHQGDAGDTYPVKGFVLWLFIPLLETYHFDARPLAGQRLSGPARPGIPWISGIHDRDGVLTRQF